MLACMLLCLSNLLGLHIRRRVATLSPLRVWTTNLALALASSSEMFDSRDECCKGRPGVSGMQVTDGPTALGTGEVVVVEGTVFDAT